MKPIQSAHIVLLINSVCNTHSALYFLKTFFAALTAFSKRKITNNAIYCYYFFPDLYMVVI